MAYMTTAAEKLKHLILLKAVELEIIDEPTVDNDNLDRLYAELVERGENFDPESEIRGGEAETGIKCDWSRNFESKAVAARYLDGSWIGWTYWYGGGKHAEPDAIDWIEDAYDLVVTEEEKLVTVRTFEKAA